MKRPSTTPAGDKGAEIVSYSFINSAPRVDGDQVVLGDGGPLRGEFRLKPTESGPALRERLDSAPKKHKR